MSKIGFARGVMGAAALATAALIIPFEGTKLKAYLDPPGIPTICTGHTKGVTLGQVATPAECALMLEEDVKEVDAALNRLVKVKMTEKTRAAFISFVFNIGQGRFAKSTALRKLNSGDTAGACDQILRWVYSGGQALPGLQRRRNAEWNLCMEGVQ